MSVPFLDALHVWLTTGVCPTAQFGGFMIEPNILGGTNLKAFTLRADLTPSTMGTTAEKCLIIGSYQSVLRKHSAEFTSVTFDRAHLKYDQASLANQIQILFESVNRTMLSLLDIHGQNLASIFSHFKQIFFTDRGDILQAFFESCDHELEQPAFDLDLSWLQMRFEVIDSNLSFVYFNQTVFEQLLGILSAVHTNGSIHNTRIKSIDAFSACYQLSFPMNLVVSEDAMSKYQIIFRFLVSLNHVHWQLSKKCTQPRMAGLIKQLALSRQYLLHFFSQTLSFVNYQVLHAQHSVLTSRLENASGLDRIIDLHTNYLDSCLRECLLTHPKLVQLLAALISIARSFYEFQTACSDPIASASDQVMQQAIQIHQQIVKQVRIFIDALQYYSSRDSEHYLGNLLSHLDYSFFYLRTSANLAEENHISGMAD